MWLSLPLPLAHLANEAVAAGFSLHHANPAEGSIVLSAWLEDSASRLPHYAAHNVGVSGEGVNGVDIFMLLMCLLFVVDVCCVVDMQEWCSKKTLNSC